MTKTKRIKGLILAGTLVLAGTIAAAEGRCYTAEIPGSVVLPDGSRHAPGTLRICTDRAISPVSNLHRTFVGGTPVGMFFSTPRAIEDSVDAGTAQFIFERGAGDELNLVGYVVSARDKTTIYEMARAGKKVANTLRAERDERGERVVFVASAR